MKSFIETLQKVKAFPRWHQESHFDAAKSMIREARDILFLLSSRRTLKVSVIAILSIIEGIR